MRARTSKKPNIILIVIDALRARNLGCYGGPEDASPHIDRLASNGILFENAFSCWNTTDQSLTSIMTGRYPRTHGIMHHGEKITAEDLRMFARLRPMMLAEILRAQGYRTLAIDWMGRWYLRGFEDYGYRVERRLLQKLIYYAVTLPRVHLRYIRSGLPIVRLYKRMRKSTIAKDIHSLKEAFESFRFLFELARIHDSGVLTRVARERVERIKTEKFFLFLHYWDTHPPFHCPRAHMPQVSSGDEEDVLEAKYRGAVRYVDQNIGEFVRFLEEKALLENSLVILTSDHGESLREHNILFDHHGLYDVTTHVPLVWHAPGLFPESRRIPALVQHVDILPTVCDILGTEASGDAFDGQSLLPLISGKTSSIRDHVLIEESCAQRRVALRNLTHKYILAPDGAAPCRYCQRIHGGAEELYDLEKDPDETHNRIRSDPEQAARMRQRLEEILRDLADRRDRDLKKSPLVPRHQEPVIPPKERKKIRRKFKCLGYYD